MVVHSYLWASLTMYLIRCNFCLLQACEVELTFSTEPGQLLLFLQIQSIWSDQTNWFKNTFTFTATSAEVFLVPLTSFAHVHLEQTESSDLISVAKEFMAANSRCINYF